METIEQSVEYSIPMVKLRYSLSHEQTKEAIEGINQFFDNLAVVEMEEFLCSFCCRYPNKGELLHLILGQVIQERKEDERRALILAKDVR